MMSPDAPCSFTHFRAADAEKQQTDNPRTYRKECAADTPAEDDLPLMP